MPQRYVDNVFIYFCVVVVGFIGGKDHTFY